MTRTLLLCAHCRLPIRRSGYVGRGTQQLQWYCGPGCAIAKRVTDAIRAGRPLGWPTLRLVLALFCALTVLTISVWHAAGTPAEFAEAGGRAGRLVMCAVATLVMLLLAPPFLRLSLQDLRDSHATMATLVSLGATAAYSWSAYATLTGHPAVYFDVAVMLLVFLTAAHLIEAAGRASATRDLEPLLTQRASVAHLVGGTGVMELRPDEVRVGDLVQVLPGEEIPVDGLVREGESTMDVSLLTGETTPQRVVTHSPVAAGSINGAGTLTIVASAVGRDTVRGRLLSRVEIALTQAPAVSRWAGRVATVLIVIVLALAAGMVWNHLRMDAGWERALLAGLTVLVVASPSAFGSAGPIASAFALSHAARAGVIVRAASVLERLVRVDWCVWDKTGTLTTGHPDIARIVSFDNVLEDDLLLRAAAVQGDSTHPIARALRRAATGRRLVLPAVLDAKIVPGRGAAGTVPKRGGDATYVWVGSAVFLQEAAGLAVPPDVVVDDTTDDPGFDIWVGWGGALRGRIRLSDTIRPEAAAVVRALGAMGLTGPVLSGDRAESAAAVAQRVGLAHASGGLSPEQKADFISAAQAKRHRLLFVGDGFNDGPALATADVGVTIESGVAAAKAAADVTILGDRLNRIPWLITFARRTVRVMRQNIAWACVYNGVAVSAAMLGKLTPIVAAGAMAFSSAFVVLNSLRLRSHALPPAP